MSTKSFPAAASASPKIEVGIVKQEHDIEDSLEPHVQHFIKNIHKAYQESMVSFNNMLNALLQFNTFIMNLKRAIQLI